MSAADGTERRSLAFSHGVVSVESLGGMLGPTLFVLPDGRQIAPFHVAPWAEGPRDPALPGILQRLRGEWPCVPFGADGDRNAAAGWPGSQAAGTIDRFPHGYSSNHDWQFLEASDERIGLAIDYPDDHPVARLERHVSPVSGKAELAFSLTIVVRKDCTLPIGLHPCLRLPATPGMAQIEIDGRHAAWSFPGVVDDTARIAPNKHAGDWHDVELSDGRRIDPAVLPFDAATEDLLQILDVGGEAALWNKAEGYRVRLYWEAAHFPSLLLWFSNRGRQMAPWNGRHLALGMEPICAAFDLGPQISAASNPIAAKVPTARRFTAGERFTTTYRIGVEAAERA